MQDCIDRPCSAKLQLYTSMPALQLQSPRYTIRSQKWLLQATLLTIPLADACDMGALNTIPEDKTVTLCKAVRTF